jgi:hypothetical protein
MRAKKSSSDEPKWKLIERIVALLEQSLIPDAKVEHNVFLPVIGIKGDKRQCDVVITYGRDPRTMVAIVEVQDRTKSMEINDFNGWITKMNEVGAHMLICVSEKDFPASIKNRVLLKHGKKVKLLTLKELAEPNILKMKLSPVGVIANPTFNIISVGMMKVKASTQLPPESEMHMEIHSSDDKVFEWDKSHERHSLNDLVSSELRNLDLRSKTANLQPGANLEIDLNICHDESENALWVHQGEQKFKVRDLPMKVAIGIQESKVSLKCYSYKQEIIDDVIAWVASASGVIGEKTHEFQLVFHPGEDGTLRLVSVRLTEGDLLNLFIGFPDEASAMAEFRRILQENPDPALALYDSGVALHNLGRNEEAIIAYDNSIKDKSQNCYGLE